MTVQSIVERLQALVAQDGPDPDGFYAGYSALAEEAARLTLADHKAGAFAFQTLYRAIGRAPSRRATHEMIAAWALLPPPLQPLGHRLAKDAVEFLALGHGEHGSWRDVRDACETVRDRSRNNTQHPFIEFCVRLLAQQVADDLEAIATERPSLCAKWVPRERSVRHGWLFSRVAKQYYLAHHPRTNTEVANDHAALHAIHSRSSAAPFWTPTRARQAKRHTRRALSRLNAAIGTLEVDMCARRWCQIDPAKVPRAARRRYARALLNVRRDNSTRTPTGPQPPHANRGWGADDDDRATLLGPVDPAREALAQRCRTVATQRATPRICGRRRAMATSDGWLRALWSPRYERLSSAGIRGIVWQRCETPPV